MTPKPSLPDDTAPRPIVFWAALALALLLAALTLAYFAQAQTLRSATLAIVAALQLALALTAAVSADFLRQRRTAWAARLMGFSVLATLVLATISVAGLGPALILIALLAVPVIASQWLPAPLATPVVQMSVVTGVLLGVLTLFPPLPPATITAAQALAPALALLALVPYALVLARDFQTYNLRAKLILAFVAVAIIPLGVLTALNNNFTRRTLTDTANHALTAAAAQTAARIDEYLDHQQNTLRSEAQLPEFKNYLALAPADRASSPLKKEVANLLQILKDKDSVIAEYLLLDSAGDIIAATSTLDVGENKAEQDFFKNPFTTGQPFISPVYFFDRAQNGSLFLSNLVFDASSDKAGVLVARYDARQVLQDLLTPANGLAGPESFAILLDENHLRLAHSSTPELAYKALVPFSAEQLAQLQAASRLPAVPVENLATDLPEFEEALSHWQQQPLFSAEAGETEELAAGGQLPDQLVTQPLKTQSWLVVFGQPQYVFLATLEAQTQLAVGLTVLIAVAVGLIALAMAQLLSGPIVRLTAVAQHVTAGNVTQRALVESSDEIGELATAFNGMTDRLNDLISSLENRVAARTAQLRAVADIGRATTSIRDIGQLLPLALELIRGRFGFYHASIFLLDEAGEFAVLRESTGEAGRQLKARRHQLAVGSRSLVGRATHDRMPVVVQDVTSDPTHFKNPLLPDTRAEAVIPLLSGNRLVGALDVQSTQPEAFGEGEVQILQTLADQLSVAIENAELFQRTQASLAEMSALYQQVTGGGWRTITHGQKKETVYDLTPVVSGGTQPLLRDPVVIPLELRGQTVGMIELHGRRPASLTAEERAVLEAVRVQLSVALESAALLEETQRRSRREQLINDITYQIRSSLNPTTILQSGIRELGRALGATEVTVRLTPAAEASRPTTGPLAAPEPEA